jgi:hypothetical protein
VLKSVSVSGIALVGEALTASTTPAGAAVVYQWQKSDSENGTYTDIVGATGNTYELTSEDDDKWIRVMATGTGDYMGAAISNPKRIYDSGSGTINDPFPIATADELKKIGSSEKPSDKYYVQIADIDLSGEDNWVPLPAFSGTYDGNGYTISNLKIDRTGTDYVGLFSSLSSSGKLININLKDVDVKGKNYVGGLVGDVTGGIIEDSCVSGSVYGTNSFVGGLVGGINTTDIKNSYTSCTVSGSADYIGGLVGSSLYCIIIQSYATGNVSGNNYVGGLVGFNMGSSISYCYAVGEVSSNNPKIQYIGGSVGLNYSTIVYVYYNSETSGQNDTDKGTPRTTEQMKRGTANSVINGEPIYTGWDPAVWDFGDETDYPVLR